MPIIRLLIAYDGSGFRGFARQPGHRTIEGVLLDALERVIRRRPRLSVAGRTDAGVHAEGQVVSFVSEEPVDAGEVQRAVNAMLGPEVVVRQARQASQGFDARRSATGRVYRYRIRTTETPDPFSARFEWHRPGHYGLAPVRRAARLLEGEHDFTSFCRRPSDGGSTRRRLRRLSVRRTSDHLEVTAEADSFLHQMVRSLVGTLVAVGEGRMDPQEMPAVIEARSRAAAGPVAPPGGLALIAVRYVPYRATGGPTRAPRIR